MPLRLPLPSPARGLVGALLLTVATAGTLRSQETPPPSATDSAVAVVDIDTLVRADLEGAIATGVTVGVVAGGELDFLQSWGLRAEGGDSLRVTDTFTYPALTEILIAMTIRALGEGGAIDPSAPLSAYLPDIPDALGAVTLDHLLTHTAGLVDDVLPEAGPERLLTLTADDFVAAPGEVYSSSRYSYPLAALVLERVLGLPFAEIATQAVLLPLGMNSSTFDPAAASERRPLTGYTWNGEERRAVAATPSYLGLPTLHTTTPDVLQLLTAWVTGGIRGSDPVAARGAEAERLDPSFRFSDGVIVDVEALTPQAVLTRFDGGFGTTFHLYPLHETVLFVMSNGPLPRATVLWLRQRVSEAVGDIETRMASEGVPVYRSNESTRAPTGLDDLAVWEGVYRNGPIQLALRHVDGQLHYFDGTTDLPLRGVGPATFAYVTGGGAVPLRLVEVADGRMVLIEGKAYRWESADVPAAGG